MKCCSNCNLQYGDEVNFCSKCGAPLHDLDSSQQLKPDEEKTKKKNFSKIVAVILLLASFAGYYFYQEHKEMKEQQEIAYISEAAEYFEANNMAGAISSISKAIELYPDKAVLYSTRAMYHSWSAKPEYGGSKQGHLNALADYNKAISLEPKNDEFYAERAEEHRVSKSEYDEAMTDANKAISINPKNAHAYSIRARLYAGRQDWEKAISDYSLAIASRDVNTYYALNYTLRDYAGRAVLYEITGEKSLAIRDYKKMLELDPKDKFGVKGVVRIMESEGWY